MQLNINNLTVKYDETVISNLDLTVLDGEFATLVGHSGTGKSTILKSVAGLVDLRCHSIKLDGKEIHHLPVNQREIGYVFQDAFLFPHLNVFDNIAYSLKLRKWEKIKIKQRVNELLDLLELQGLGTRMPKELSGGQQQRVAIGRAIAYHPHIVLMDEPFSSLDPILRQNMGDFIKALQKKLGLTVIFVTHDPIEAMRLSDRIAFIHDGQVIQYDIPDNIYLKPNKKVIGDFFGLANYLESERGLMFFRPHEVSLSKGQDYKIIDLKSTGKTCVYTLQKENETIYAESLGQLFHVQDRVDISIQNSHYIQD